MKKQPKESSSEVSDDLIKYMSFMGSLIEKKPVSKAEMKQSLDGWQKKWRQRPLSFWQKHYKLPSGVVKNGDTS